MTPRLSCCRPTAYAPGSSYLVHSPACEVAPELGLSEDEFTLWRSRIRHPTNTVYEPVLTPTQSIAVALWREHTTWCTCWTCGYVDAHLDDTYAAPAAEGV